MIRLVLVLAIAFAALLEHSAFAETCIASVYGTHDRDQNGNRTASGIPLVDGVATMAHKSLRLRSYALVTNLRTGRAVRLLVSDRGPYIHGRCVDLSHEAAHMLGISSLGRVTAEAAP